MRNRIIYQVTFRYMKMNKKRTMTAFLGIACMVLLMTCVFVGKSTAINYLEQAGSARDGSWHISIYDITEKELKELKNLDFVAETAVSQALGCTEFAASGSEEHPYLNIRGYSAACFEWMNIAVSGGRLPENKNEVLISEAALQDGARLEIGDTISARYFQRSVTGLDEKTNTSFPFYDLVVNGTETVDVPLTFPFFGENDSFRENRNYTGQSQELTVVGFMEAPAFEDAGAAGYEALTCVTEEELTAGTDTFNVSLKLDQKHLPDDYIRTLRDLAGEKKIDFNDYVLAFSGNSSDSTVNLIVNGMTAFFLVIIIGASIVLIHNLFSLSFEERSRYLGMLCSVGATGKQKRASVYFEALFLLVSALPAGILAGVGAVWFCMQLLQPFLLNMVNVYDGYEKIPVTLAVSWKNLGSILLVSVLTVIVSAVLPARRIGRTGPIVSIKGNDRVRIKNKALSERLIRAFGAEGMVARGGLRVRRRKTRGIVRAAAVFVIILIVTAAGTESTVRLVKFRTRDSSMVNVNRDGWDYFFASLNVPENEYEVLREEIISDPGVESVREWKEGIFIGDIPWDTFSEEYRDALHQVFNLYYHRELTDEEFEGQFMQGGGTLNVIGLGDEEFTRIAELTDTDMGILEQAEHPAIVVQYGEVSTENWSIGGMTPEKYQFYQISKMTDLEQGSEMPVRIYSEQAEEQVDFPLTVAGYASAEQLDDYFSFHTEMMYVLVNAETAEDMNQILDPEGNSSNRLEPDMLIRMNGEETDLVKRLTDFAENDDDYIFIPADYQMNFTDSIVAVIRILLAGFVVLSSALCLLNLYNSIHGQMAARQQELAVLKSVGAGAEQIRKIILYECCGILGRSLLWGIVIATPLVWLCRSALTHVFGHVVFTFPWPTYLVAALTVAAAVFGFSTWLLHRMDKGNIIECIRNENA